MVKNQSVAVALLLVIIVGLIVGLIANEKNIRSQPDNILERRFAAPKFEMTGGSASRAIAIDHDFVNSDRSAENELKNIFHFEADEEEDSQQPSNAGIHGIVTPDCLRARHDTVPESLFQKLPKPYINLGFPKMGTSSLHSYFKCGGLKSSHWRCRRRQSCALCTRNSVIGGLPPLAQNTTSHYYCPSCRKGCSKHCDCPQNTTCRKECSEFCADCIQLSVESGLSPLSKCGKYDVYTQVDDGYYFPQIELLEQFLHGYSNATFFLSFRNMTKWYHSISNWPPGKNGPHMDERLKMENITGSPSNETESSSKEFIDWYCKHVKRVRNLVAQNPLHTLVEVDIEDPEIGQRMEDIFGIGKGCWGRENVNVMIHPEINQSGGETVQLFNTTTT